MLHFDAAINPYGPSPRVEAALVAFARSRAYRFYGEQRAESLRDRLADHLGLTPEHLIVFNGAGEALVWLFVSRLLLERGRLLAPYPSYERFVDAGKRCAEVVEVPLAPGDFSLPVDRVIEAGRRREVTMGLLSNPNNPSGNLLLDDESLSCLLDALPQCLWVVDEAYADYAGVTFAPWVQERKNLVVLRTFSKAYGLAGLRVGYAVAHPEIIRRLAALQIPWCVDSMALVAAEAALADQAYLKQVAARILADCEALGAGLSRIPGFQVYPSAANFFLVRLHGIDTKRLKAHLATHRIQVRSRPDMPDCVRVTSLTPEENAYLLDVVSRLPQDGDLAEDRVGKHEPLPSLVATL